MSLSHWLNLFSSRSRSRWSRSFKKPRRRRQCVGIVAVQIESCEPRIVLDAAAGAVARDAFAGDSDEGIFASLVSELAEVGQAINDVAVDALLSADEALDGALFAADSSLNTVIDLVDPVSDSIYGTLDAFVDTAVPLIDAGIDVIQTLADSSLFEEYVDELATAALSHVETAIAENPITVWLYTGDFDATPEMIAAAYDAAGMFYIGNAGLAHEALGGVDGELADSVATVLVWIEGEELHSMVLENTPDLPTGVVYLPGGPDDLPAEYLAGPNVPPVQVIPANQAVLVAIRDYWRTVAAATQLSESLETPEGNTPIAELNPIDGPAHSAPRPELQALTDAELLEAVRNPENGDHLVRSTIDGILRDGNGRAYELIRRAADPESMITPDMLIPVEEYTPDLSMFPDLE